MFTREDFSFECIKVGMTVSEEVIDDLMNCMPPASYRSDCAQVGEPYGHREDPETGRWRPTYGTFKRSDKKKEAWVFCGYCFRGENVVRGTDPVYACLE